MAKKKRKVAPSGRKEKIGAVTKCHRGENVSSTSFIPTDGTGFTNRGEGTFLLQNSRKKTINPENNFEGKGTLVNKSEGNARHLEKNLLEDIRGEGEKSRILP